MREVIGYIDNTFTKEFCEKMNVDTDYIVGAKMQLCFGKVKKVDDDQVEIEPTERDIVDELIHNNIGEVKAYDFLTEEAIVEFMHPIPLEYFQEYYAEKTPLFEKTWQ